MGVIQMGIVTKIAQKPFSNDLKVAEVSNGFNFIRKFKEISSNPSEALEKLQQKLLSGHTFSPSELLSYQVMAHRFGLSIEVATKIADGISSSVRKLQTQ